MVFCAAAGVSELAPDDSSRSALPRMNSQPLRCNCRSTSDCATHWVTSYSGPVTPVKLLNGSLSRLSLMRDSRRTCCTSSR